MDAARTTPNSPTRPARRRIIAHGLLACTSLAFARHASAAHVVKPWPEARPVPTLVLADLDGNTWRLDAARGKVVVLNFWATWCEPCRLEMPSLSALSETRSASGLTVVAVNYREPAAKVREFIGTTPLKATVLLDADGDAAMHWTPRVFPTTVVIGRDGQPALTVVGDLDWVGEDAKRLLAPLLAAPVPKRPTS